jgi:hypothetical protein
MKGHFSDSKFSKLNSDYCDQVSGISLISVGWKSGILFPTGPEIFFCSSPLHSFGFWDSLTLRTGGQLQKRKTEGTRL